MSIPGRIFRGVIAISIFTVVALIGTSTSSSPVSAFQGAETTYKTKCAACHGLDGSGATPMGKSMKLRDLKSAEVQKQTDAQLLAIISKGKNKMPAFEQSLGAATCKALVAHLREIAKKK